MANEILKLKTLENVLQQQCNNFLDYLQLLQLVLKHVRENEFKEIIQEDMPQRQVKMSVTSFKFCKNNPNTFELWIEYSVPKEQGVVIGTNVYFLNLTGEIILNESYGTFFRPQNSS